MTNESVAPSEAPRSRFVSDRGYAAVLVALVLVPLMGFAGLAVDIGAWYSRASSLQRAADAAALAGVVWQPDFATAEANARQEAARNGFVDGVDGISVNIVDTGLNELEVEIIDSDADMFFASLFLDNVSISRHSVAEYTKSIPMGNPDNYLGTDPEAGISEQNYLSISGANTDKKGGDRHASKRCDGSTALCTNGALGNLVVNGGEFDENGYTYSVSVNTIYASPLVFQVYDPGFYEAEQSCNPGGGSNMPPGYDFNDLLAGGLGAMFPGDGFTDPARVAHWTERYANSPGAIYCSGDTPSNGAGSITSFYVRAPDNTPFNILDNPIISTGTCSPQQFGAYDEPFYDLLEQVGTAHPYADTFAAEFRRWVQICEIPAGQVVLGDYIIQVRTNASAGAPTFYDPSYNQGGRNHFSLRAGYDTGGSAPDGTGVELFATGTMAIDVNVPGASTVMELAKITPEYAGRTLRIELWDVGDAAAAGVLTILPPVESPSAFSNCRFTNTNGGWSDGDPTDCSAIVSSAMNGNLLTIEVDLPSGYTCNPAIVTGCFVRVQVAFPAGTTVYDHTTWAVDVVGDPVRLLE